MNGTGGGTNRPPPDDIRGWGRKGGGRGFTPGYAGAGASPMAAGLVPPAGYAPSRFPVESPYVVRPPGGVDFNPTGFQTGFTNLNTPAVIPGTAFTLPLESVGIIRSVVLTVNNLLLTSVIRWAVRFNESPVSGWQALTVVPGAVAYFALSYGPDETYIRAPDGTTIDITFTVDAADAGNYTAGASYHGWYFSKEMAAEIDRAYL